MPPWCGHKKLFSKTLKHITDPKFLNSSVIYKIQVLQMFTHPFILWEYLYTLFTILHHHLSGVKFTVHLIQLSWTISSVCQSTPGEYFSFQ